MELSKYLDVFSKAGTITPAQIENEDEAEAVGKLKNVDAEGGLLCFFAPILFCFVCFNAFIMNSRKRIYCQNLILCVYII